MKKCNLIKSISIAALTALFFSTPLWAAGSSVSQWTVAAVKFNITNEDFERDMILDSAASMFPSRIMENLSSSAYRTIQPDEEYQRKFYELKKQRTALFLQLSAAIKNRDALILQNYSDSKLKSRILSENKKIEELRAKVEENTRLQKKAMEESETKNIKTDVGKEKTEGQKYIELFKNLFSTKNDSAPPEKIVVFEKDESVFYKPQTSDNDFTSAQFEKEVVNAKINALVTGRITRIGEHISVTAELFTYPGAKSAGKITELGSLDDADFICSSIAHQLSPLLTASMPVQLNISITPEEILSSTFTKLSIDDVIYENKNGEIIIDSGNHTVTLDSPGYKTASTTYWFDGNRIYNIEINLKPLTDGTLTLFTDKTKSGPLLENAKIYANNELLQNTGSSAPVAEIQINGQPVLGNIILPDGSNAFYYINEKYARDGKDLFVKADPFDRNQYIETRRKWMYGSYSALVTSLIPLIYTYGNLYSYSQAYNSGNLEAYDTAIKYQNASYVCIGVTAACGAWFAYELTRYLLAASTVLPVEAKPATDQQIKKINEKNKKTLENDTIKNDNTENTTEE